MRSLFVALLVLASVALCLASDNYGPLPPFPPVPPQPSPDPHPLNVGPGEVRSHDGSWNNVRKPEMGMKGYLLRRQFPSNFQDPLVPNPRDISNAISTEDADHKNTLGVNMFESIFGQFINHDRENSRNDNGTYIEIPLLAGAADPLWREGGNNFFRVALSDFPTMRLERRGPVELQVPNNSTAWLDLSALYGNNDDQVSRMRSFVDGRLKTTDYFVKFAPTLPAIPILNQLPSVNITGLEPSAVFTIPNTEVTSAGDARVNENVGLTMVTTIFMREHNRLAAVAKAAHPTWSDEQLFQWARKMNIAQYQHIVFDEYLPTIVSPAHFKRIRPYRRYRRTEEGGTNMEFSHAGFRYGHSSVTNYILLDQDLCPKNIFVPAGVFGPQPFNKPHLPLIGMLGGPFMAPNAMALAGETTILRGLLYNLGNEVDHLVSNDLRSAFLSGATGSGLDLVTFDIVRGRLDGLASYHELRKKFFDGPSLEFGYANVYNHPDCTTNEDDAEEEDDLACFEVITNKVDLAVKLKNIYKKVTKIDAIIGLLSETHSPGSFLPRTIANIVLDEYQIMRDADRFWYENNGVLTSTEKAQVKSRTMAQIILDQYHSAENPLVSNLNNLFTNAFKVPPTTVGCCNAK